MANFDSKLVKRAGINALVASVYVALVATFLNNAQYLFGEDEPKGVLVPIAMLLLLVLSTTVMGIVIFGKPIALYLDGQKKEGVTLLLYTVGFLFLVVLMVFLKLALLPS